MELKKPVYIDSKLRRVFERYITRDPSLWGNQRVNRLFLLYGQNGSGMEEAVIQLTIEYNVRFYDVKVTTNVKQTMEDMGKVPPSLLLIVRKAHLLKHYQLPPLTTMFPNRFIVAISEDPENDEFKFTIPMSLPKKDDYARLLEYYFTSWARSGSPAVTPINLDYKELAICCDYATPKDVKHFVRAVIAHVIEEYPETRVTIDMELLQSRFMHRSLGTKDLFCITNKDGHSIQMRYDREGQATLEAPGIQEALDRALKRAKKEEEEEGEEKEETKVYLE